MKQEKTFKETIDERPRGRVEHWRVVNVFLVLYDIIAVNTAFFGALWLRFDFHFGEIEAIYIRAFTRFAPYYTVIVRPGACILI